MKNISKRNIILSIRNIIKIKNHITIFQIQKIMKEVIIQKSLKDQEEKHKKKDLLEPM